jgi:hypothetical protein
MLQYNTFNAFGTIKENGLTLHQVSIRLIRVLGVRQHPCQALKDLRWFRQRIK